MNIQIFALLCVFLLSIVCLAIVIYFWMNYRSCLKSHKKYADFINKNQNRSSDEKWLEIQSEIDNFFKIASGSVLPSGKNIDALFELFKIQAQKHLDHRCGETDPKSVEEALKQSESAEADKKEILDIFSEIFKEFESEHVATEPGSPGFIEHVKEQTRQMKNEIKNMKLTNAKSLKAINFLLGEYMAIYGLKMEKEKYSLEDIEQLLGISLQEEETSKPDEVIEAPLDDVAATPESILPSNPVGDQKPEETMDS